MDNPMAWGMFAIAALLVVVIVVLIVGERRLKKQEHIEPMPPSETGFVPRALVETENAFDAGARNFDLYGGSVYMAETQEQAAERQIQEQLAFGGDTPVDVPDGKGGRVLLYKGERTPLYWCEPPPEPEPDEAA